MARRMVPLLAADGAMDAGANQHMVKGVTLTENAMFDRRGVISMRDGVENIAEAANGHKMVTSLDGLPLAIGSTAQLRDTASWATLGALRVTDVTREGITAIGGSSGAAGLTGQLSLLRTANLYIVTYIGIDSSGNYTAEIETYDRTTLRQLYTYTAVTSANVQFCKCRALEQDNGTIRYWVLPDAATQFSMGTINESTGAISVPAALTGATAAYNATDIHWDVAHNGDYTALAYRNSGANITLSTYNDAAHIGTTGITATLNPMSVGLCPIASDDFGVAWTEGAGTGAITGYGGVWDAPTLANVIPATLAMSNTGSAAEALQAVCVDDESGELKVWYSAEFTANQPVVYYNRIATGGAVDVAAASLAPWAYAATIAARPSANYVPLFVAGVFGTVPIQPGTVVMMRHATTTGESLAQISPSRQWDPAGQAGTGCFPATFENDVLGSSEVRQAGYSSYEGRDIYTVFANTITNNTHPHCLPNGDITHVAGSQPYVIDKDGIWESGFITYPKTTTEANSTGGSMVAGYYRYRAIYERVDSRGNIYRSAPSDGANEIQVTGNACNVTFQGPGHHRGAADGKVYTVLFRTAVAAASPAPDGPYYRVAKVEGRGTITFQDTFADSSITTNELLYTNGRVIENTPQPPTTAQCVWDRRHWAVDAERPWMLRCSKQFVDGEGLSHSDYLQVLTPTDDGPITAIVPLASDRLAVFKERAIYAITGQGYDVLLGGGNYRDPYRISDALGAANDMTVTRTPNGVMFLGADEQIWTLTPSMQLEPSGQAVREYTIVDAPMHAVTMPDEHLAVFLLNDQTTLLAYNYLHGKWSRWTVVDSTSAGYVESLCVIDGTMYLIAGDTNSEWLRKWTRTLRDNNTSFPLAVETGWLPLGEAMGGAGRVHKLIALGYYESATGGELPNIPIVTAYVAYDYDSRTEETLSYTLTGLSDTWGPDDLADGLINGSGTLDQAMIAEFTPSRTKATAIKVRLEVKQTWTDGRVDAHLTGLAALISQRRGAFRTTSGRQA